MVVLVPTLITPSSGVDTSAAITSLCKELEKDASPYQMVFKFDTSKCNCQDMPEACTKLGTLPYNFKVICEIVVPEQYKSFVKCDCSVFPSTCTWFEKANTAGGGGGQGGDGVSYYTKIYNVFNF